MEEKIAVANPGKTVMFVGTTMIPPGETRHFWPHEVPAHLKPAPEASPEAPPPDPLAELLAGSVRAISAAIKELPTADLERLRPMEEASETPRKTLLAAIDEEILDRAIAAEEAAKQQEAAG